MSTLSDITIAMAVWICLIVDWLLSFNFFYQGDELNFYKWAVLLEGNTELDLAL